LLCDFLVPRVDVRAPLRQAAVDLHRRQMRSPIHSLGKGAAQTKHGLVLGTMYRPAPGLLWWSGIELSRISNSQGRTPVAYWLTCRFPSFRGHIRLVLD
jgi:hypothetical protein